MASPRYVLAVDVGTSRMRCVAVDHDGKTLSQREAQVKVIHPSQDASEIDPLELWTTFVDVVKDTLESGQLEAQDAVCLGITTLRNTFLLWEKDTGTPLCNFNTWQDRRSAQDCIEWNKSLQLKTLQTGATIAHFVTRINRFMAASVIKFITNQVIVRLWWTLNNIAGSRERGRAEEICFGTVDTWLIWKLTNGQVHATDYSNASATAIYDTYQLEWSGLIMKIFDIPSQILPDIVDSGGNYGQCHVSHFGSPIPITGNISDQTSATFAQMCWSPGDIKCTMGTGMFIDINTGSRPHASATGLYPLIGWKIGHDITYLAEGMFSSIGSVIEWGKAFGLYSDPSETENIALTVHDSHGVYFVPCFDGIQAPHNDPTSTGSILGITYDTRKEHIVRALLESIAFVCKQLIDVAKSEVNHPITKLRVDGGVCKNSFVLQLISNLLQVPIEKPSELDQTVFGAVYVAGLGAGFWTSRDKIKSFWKMEQLFEPNSTYNNDIVYAKWQDALHRSLKWYQNNQQ